MKAKEIINILLKNKTYKLCLVSFLLVGSVVCSSVSFAKYIEEYKENQEAGVADFNGYSVSFSSSPISITNTAPIGTYAFKLSFKVNFDASEVKRAYSMEIKPVSATISPSSYDETSAYSNSAFYLQEVPSTIYTSRVVSNNAQIVSSGVASLLTNNDYSSFTANNVYLRTLVSDNVADTINSDFTTLSSTNVSEGSLKLADNVVINAAEVSYHHYEIIYFTSIDTNNLTPFNFIYKIDLLQVQ